MGKKDVTGKEFFADKRRFAELLNVALYQKEDIIQAGELEQMTRIYPSFAGNSEMSRDVFMKDRKRNICYGLELETESDYSMPERVMVYDACELERQIKEIGKSRKEEEREEKEQEEKEKFDYRAKKSRMKETDVLLPVVTIVLYLGTGHWEGKRKLSELYPISAKTEEAMRERLPDYEFPLMEADFMDPDSFRTELKEFFQAMQCREDKEKLGELLRTERFKRLKKETIGTIAVYLDRKGLKMKIEEEGLDMCKALAELLADERAEGIKKGRAEGIEKGRNSIIRNMIQQGLDQEFICRVTGCSKQEFASAAES